MQLYNETFNTFESVRQEIYEKIMDERVEAGEARSNMQKAYCKYATISSSHKSTDAEATRSRWPDLVAQV